MGAAPFEKTQTMWYLLSFVAGILSTLGVTLFLRRPRTIDQLDRINDAAREQLEEKLNNDRETLEEARTHTEAEHRDRLSKDESELIRRAIEAANEALRRARERRKRK